MAANRGLNFPFNEWLAELKELFQNEEFDYSEVSEHVNWYAYWQDNHEPAKAIEYAIEMMDA